MILAKMREMYSFLPHVFFVAIAWNGVILILLQKFIRFEHFRCFWKYAIDGELKGII